jgi:hypothetical protein
MRAIVLCLFAIGSLLAADPPRLADSGLPAGRSEDLLPPGAVLHVRIGNLARSLENLDTLARQFVPEKALPPDIRNVLTQPHGLLRHLGQLTVGAPIDAALIARLSGIDAGRPATCTLYVTPAGLDWVLCLPVADHAALTGLIVNQTRARSFTPAMIGSRQGWVVVGANPELPEQLVVVCSADAAYICSSDMIAARIGGSTTLAVDPLIAKLPATADITIAISTAPAKPFLQMFAMQFAKLPPRMADGMRQQVLRAIGADGLRGLNLQMRLYLGLGSVEEALDYVECMVGAGMETFVPALTKSLMGVDGAALSIEILPDAVRGALIVQAAGIEANAGKPLPMPELSKALAALPVDRMWFSATGGRTPAAPGSLRADWADLAARKLVAKGVTSAFLPALAGYWREAERVPVLEDASPWVLRTSVRPTDVVPARAGLEAWIAAAQAAVPMPDLEVTPRQDADAAVATFTAIAAVENRNAARWTKVLTTSVGDSRWVDSVARFRREVRAGKAERLVYEDAWITRSGLFGYSQHELINRIIAYSAQRDGLQLLQRVDGDRTCWLDEPPAKPGELPAAVAGLLVQVPAGADQLTVVRVLPGLKGMIDGTESLEKAVREDLDAYIAACTAAINAHPGDEPAIVTALQRIPMPFMVASLNIAPVTRELYLVLPGTLRYPRPALSPVLRQIFAETLRQADAHGGLVAWTRFEPGRMTLAVHQDLRGLAWLVRTTGNTVYDLFLSSPDPLARLRRLLGQEADGQPNPGDQVILYNTLWPETP